MPSSAPTPAPRRLAAATIVLGLLAGLLVGPAAPQAHEYRVGGLRIDHPWTRASPGMGRTGAGYLVLVNESGQDDRLTGATTPVAARVEIHSHAMEDGIMRMRPVVGGLAVPAGETATLAPGHFHLMLIGLSAPLVEGERIPLTLTFKRAGAVTVELQVESAGAMGETGDDAGGHDHGS